MNVTRLAMFVIVLTSFFSTCAAQSAQESQSSQPSFSLTISTPRQTVKSGSAIPVKIIATNTTDHELTLPILAGDEFHIDMGSFTAEVRDAKGTLVSLTKDGETIKAHGVIGNGLKIPIESGKSEKWGIIISKLYNVTQPGNYTIQVQKLDFATGIIVKSNTIAVKVTE